jgi:hypothetical protein
MLRCHNFGSGHTPSVTIVITPVRTLLVVSYSYSLELVKKDSTQGTTCLQLLVCSTLAIVKVVIAVILEDGLRHDGVAFAERRGSVEDFACSVGHDVGLAVL